MTPLDELVVPEFPAPTGAGTVEAFDPGDLLGIIDVDDALEIIDGYPHPITGLSVTIDDSQHAAAPGYRWRWPGGGDMTFNGPLRATNPGFEGRWAFCIQSGIPFSPGASIGHTVGAPGHYRYGPRVAFLRSHPSTAWFGYQYWEAPQRLAWMQHYIESQNSQHRANNAAVSWLTKMFFEEHGGTGGGMDAHGAPGSMGRITAFLAAMRDITPQHVLDAAYRLWHQAGIETNLSGNVGSHRFDTGRRYGTRYNIGVHRGDGTWVPGINVVIGLDGPGEWIPETIPAGWRVVPGSNGRYIEGLSAGHGLEARWRATGDGPVDPWIEYSFMGQYLMGGRNDVGVQDVLYTENSLREHRAQGIRFEVRRSFDFTITTALDAQLLNPGQGWGDVVTLAPATPDSVWPTGVAVAMVADVQHGFDYFGQTVRDGVPLANIAPTQQIRFYATGFGDQRISGPGHAASGHGFVNVRVDTARLSAAARSYLHPDFHNAQHGPWQPSQSWVVRMTPVVQTQVGTRVIDERDLPQPLVDGITVSLPDGGRWIHTGGPANPQPYELRVEARAFGFTDVPYPRTPWAAMTPAQRALQIGSDTLTFTGPGTQYTSDTAVIVQPGPVTPPRDNRPSPVGPGGFATWTAHYNASRYIAAAFDSDWFIESQTTTIREDLQHWSQLQDHNLVPGGRIADNMRIGGFRESHGAFDGLPGTSWRPDLRDARVVAYGPLTEPGTTATVPTGAPVHGEVLVPAGATYLVGTDGSGEFEIGFGELNLPRIPLFPPDGIEPVYDRNGVAVYSAYYVVVFHFDGDDRAAPFVSRFDDERQTARVTWTRPPALPPVAVPRIDVEKVTCTDDGPGHGSGMFMDRPNNLGDRDHDTRSTAKEIPVGQETEQCFRITNNGGENLTEITASDVTLVGDAVTEIEWDFAVNAAGLFIDADGNLLVLAPGEYFFGRGTLPALRDGEYHQNLITVYGRGEESGLDVGDEDPWWGVGRQARIDIEKTHAFWPVAGNGNGMDEDNNRSRVIVPLTASLHQFDLTRTGRLYVNHNVTVLTLGEDGQPDYQAAGWILEAGNVLEYDPANAVFIVVVGPQTGQTVPVRELTGVDADNVQTAIKVGPGAVIPVMFAITNSPTSTEALTRITFEDVTLEGPDVTDITFVVVTYNPDTGLYERRELTKSASGYFVYDVDGAQRTLVLAPGERIGGRGTLEGLAPDETLPHGNRAYVTGEGETTGEISRDDDEFWAIDPPLAWTRALAWDSDGVQREVRGTYDQGVAVIGDTIGDTIHTNHEMVAGATASVRLFRAEPGQQPSGEDELLWESAHRILVNVDGTVSTGAVHQVTEPGIHHFHLRVYGTAGDVIYTAEYGVYAQRIYVVDITTTAGWYDTNGDGVAGVGDYFYDNIHTTGYLPAGVTAELQARAWRVPNTHVQWADREVTNADAPIPGIGLLPGAQDASRVLGSFRVPEQDVTFPGISPTEGFHLEAYDAFGLGALTWTEYSWITGPGGRVEGDASTYVTIGTEFGDTDQTIAPVNHVAGGAGGAVARPTLPITGADPLTWVIGTLGAALLAYGISRTPAGKKALHTVAAKMRPTSDQA